MPAAARPRPPGKALREDLRDLLLRGALVVETPAPGDVRLVAMTVIQLDGDVILRLYQAITPAQLAAHVAAVSARLGGIRRAVHTGLRGASLLAGAVPFLAVLLAGGIENVLLRLVAAAATGTCLGVLGRRVTGVVVRRLGAYLFHRYLQERS